LGFPPKIRSVCQPEKKAAHFSPKTPGMAGTPPKPRHPLDKSTGLQTEYEFTLPAGYVEDGQTGAPHKKGFMRLSTAAT